jgi:hypothetical protein
MRMQPLAIGTSDCEAYGGRHFGSDACHLWPIRKESAGSGVS